AVIDGHGPLGAINRSIQLLGASSSRAGAIRLIGYLTWLGIRVVIGIGGAWLLTGVVHGDTWLAGVTGLPPTIAFLVILATTWSGVGAIALPALGCLDAAIHLETRVRFEALDIVIDRVRERGEPV